MTNVVTGPTCHAPDDLWCGDEPAVHCEWRARTVGVPEHELIDLRIEFNTSTTFAFPSRAALEVIARETPVVEVGAGSGYWARLLRNLGADVEAIDDGSWTSADLSEHVSFGDGSRLSAHGDRTLFICMPPRSSLGAWVTAYPGRRIILVTEGPIPNRIIPEYGTMPFGAPGSPWVRLVEQPLHDPHNAAIRLSVWERHGQS